MELRSYNTEEGKDNWNYENYSLLGPDRKPRNVDAVARPYPMRSAEPTLIFFDIDSKYAAIILKGKVVTEEPTVVYSFWYTLLTWIYSVGYQ